MSVAVRPSVRPWRTPVNILWTSEDISMTIARDSLSEDLQTFQHNRLVCCGGKSWVQIRVGTRDISLVQNIQTKLWSLISLAFKGQQVTLFPGIKRDTDHTPSSRAAFLKPWSADHRWVALVVLLDWTLVQKRQKK